MERKFEEKLIWQDKKRTIFGLPLSLTTYSIEGDSLFIEVGFFSKKKDRIRLYRITDTTVYKSLFQRMFGVGTIHCCSDDPTSKEFDIISVKDVDYIENMINTLAIENRTKMGIQEVHVGNSTTTVHNK